jgi:colicin import membrane protein
MPRVGVTYEQVERVAEQLKKTGVSATLRAVCELVGSGSSSTVHKHLRAWKATQSERPSFSSELPASILDAISAEIFRVSTAAKSGVEALLVEAEQGMQELASECHRLEIDKEALLDQLASIASERDREIGTSAAYRDERDALSQQVKIEQRAAENSRSDAALIRYSSEVAEKLNVEIRQELDLVKKDLESERNSRVAFERKAAVEEAGLSAAVLELVQTKALLEEARREARSSAEVAAELRGLYQSNLGAREHGDRLNGG